MAATPARKLVHWDNDPSFSELGSPFSEGSSSQIASTSTLEMLNSQLVAHGFATSPGLDLDGIPIKESEKIVKCLLGMLGQRVQDLSRTEDLTTKLRTLSYDHDRLLSMHRDAKDRAANAEREMTLYKTRQIAVTKSLHASEISHKHTTAELQKTRTALQGVRSLHQSELKKKEKEVERMAEKWSKLSDMQLKVGATSSGMVKCANAAVADGNEILGAGRGLLDVALEEAELARKQLGDDNIKLRRLVVTAVNEIQLVLHEQTANSTDEPTPFTTTTLFPISPTDVASEQLTSVISSLRACLTTNAEPAAVVKSSVSNEDSERLRTVIQELRAEMAQMKETSEAQAAAHATETQTIFDQFTCANPLAAPSKKYLKNDDDDADMSVDMIIAPVRDAEKERLDDIKAQLDQERRNFTEAAIRFGREKAALEGDRIKFLDEKRSWQVQQMLSELPATPAPAAPTTSVVTSITSSPDRAPRGSPRKSSPAKVIVGKNGTGKANRIRVSRRPSMGSPTKSRVRLASPGKTRNAAASPSKAKVEPAYETEVIVVRPEAPPPPPQLLLPAPVIAGPSSSSSTSLLPTSFVLPPSSLHSTFPASGASLLSAAPQPTPAPTAVVSTTPASPPPPPQQQQAQLLATPPPRRPFPMAKPFAVRMVHAYSPVRPSPLSRILMLADSPPIRMGSPPLPTTKTSPRSDSSLEALVEEEEEEEEDSGGSGAAMFPPLSLAAELGVVVSDEEGDEKEAKNVPRAANPVVQFGGGAKGKARATAPPPPQRTSSSSGSSSSSSSSSSTAKVAANAKRVVEKENTTTRRQHGAFPVGGSRPKQHSTRPPGKPTLAPVRKVSAERKNNIGDTGVPGKDKEKEKVGSSKPVGSRGTTRPTMTTTKPVVPASTTPSLTLPATTAVVNVGPRRVPIDSAEAPRGWRG